MKRFFLLILLAVFSIGMKAATPVLDKVISATDAKEGLRITFLITMGEGKEVEGLYSAYGKKFHFTTPEMKAWYDGTNLWVYLEQNGEVNLSLPMKEDLAMINPLLNLTEINKSAFSIKEEQLPGNKGYRITAFPKDKKHAAVEQLTAEVTKDYLPTLIRIKEKGSKEEVRVVVKNFSKGAFPEMKDKTFFSFTSSKLPGKTVIDLR